MADLGKRRPATSTARLKPGVLQTAEIDRAAFKRRVELPPEPGKITPPGHVEVLAPGGHLPGVFTAALIRRGFGVSRHGKVPLNWDDVD